MLVKGGPLLLEILNLQLKLAETTNQLAVARQELGPEHPNVKRLTEQVTRLQALSRPIPAAELERAMAAGTLRARTAENSEL